jgi:DNA polymerase III delta prime subunit
MMSNVTEFVWCEKYRPQTIDDCVLPKAIKDELTGMLSKGELPNLLFCGTAGTGKTTAALAMCDQIGADVLFINASLENGIDVLRSKISQFASSVSLTDAKKVVVLDEADYTNPQSFQPALRGFIEEFSNNVRFILTCNYKNRIIEPLHSRCAVVDFRVPNNEKAHIAGQFFKRVLSILKSEEIEYDQKVVAELIQKHFPDYRRMLNELQRYSVSGRIDSGLLVNIGNESYKQLFKLMKEKNFTEVRKWVALNSDGDVTRVFRELYDQSNTVFDPTSIPELVLTLADYSYKASFVADQEINMMAALTEIMARCRMV